MPQHQPNRTSIQTLGTVERAFEIAGSGEATGVAYIREALVREGYTSVSGHLRGGAIRAKLRALCEASTKKLAL